MNAILKMKWFVLLFWVMIVAGLLFTAPDMAGLVREKGQITVPEGYSSAIADEMAKEIGGEEMAGMTTVLAFHRDGGIGSDAMEEVRQGIAKLQSAADELGILSVMTHFDTPELAEQMVSEDGSTVISLLQVEAGGRELAEVKEELYTALSDVDVEHYYTGNWIITEDVIISSEEGLKKTEYITIGFILIILFVVFRSAAAPLVPLLTIGFSYLVSQSVVAFLVEYADFPLSNFTQIFMVAVMFGIGTDYCILLISRYKEELSRLGDKQEAIIHTYRTAGKTVLYSGLAVFVGFASIGLSTFILYQSAVAVAVGIAIMMLALFTLVPFFLSVLGNALFWPAKGSVEHKQSKLWEMVGQFSLKRPLFAIVILAVLIVPSLVAYKGAISYNTLEEIGESYDSVKGFNIVADRFGPGETLPTNVILKSEEPFDTPEGLATLEGAARELMKVEGVQAVRSATRPTGEEMEEFLVSDQVVALEDGLGQSGDGLGSISEGLAEASSALNDNAPKLAEAAKGAGDLAAGTRRLQSGIRELEAGLKAIRSGLLDGSAGASELEAGLRSAKESVDQLAAGSKELLAGYQEMGGGLTQLTTGYEAIAAEHAKLAQGLGSVAAGIGSLQESYPELKQDAAYQEALGALQGMQRGAEALGTQLQGMNEQLAGVSQGMTGANVGLAQAIEGQSALAAGLESLADGLAKLQQGVAQAASGQGSIIAQLPGVSGGLAELAAGQEELKSGFDALSSQLGELTGGLNQSVDGLNQVTDGLASAGGYLQGLAQSPNKEITGWHIPPDAIESEEFQAALDVYLSPDRRTAQLDVIFESNPYSQEAMEEIDAVKSAVQRALQNTPFSQSDVAIGGVTSMNHDLSNISEADYSRTVVLMLIGILVILLILFRSVIIPIYVVISLLITFYTSQAATELIFVELLGYSGISWAVPFFGFVLLVALGVDYSIFLMDRFREYRHLEPKTAILEAMKNMGSVIVSAAIILGGTFAAMLPSGVLSLLQIATMVLCGLFLYALVMLPLFIPVMVRTFGAANWWPFMERGEQAAREQFAATRE
ncbi:MMPL family transporter [Paenibacillus chungangensis]|uniref:MMPL family transporter n=1 Tax=Paenibacillus chungangensis TaxID=696535 RepID=A0ABW3HNS1_9BACL